MSESGLESVREVLHYCRNNLPSKIEKPKLHMLILDDCQGSNVHTFASASVLNDLSVKHRRIPVMCICFLVQSWVSVLPTICVNVVQYK